MLVNKPQFDSELISKGQAYMVNIYQYKGTVSIRTQNDKFDDGDNVLILEVHPLNLIVLTVANKQARIDVEDVASGKITLTKLVPLFEVEESLSLSDGIDNNIPKKARRKV